MTTIALIGTGLMGLPMAIKLFQCHKDLLVYNRTREKSEPLHSLGISVAEKAEEAIRPADCVVLMLTDARAIREVLFSDQCREALSGRTVIQMGTIAPFESIELQKEIERLGGDYLESPVLGSIPEAEQGRLIVMVGSTPQQFERWKSLLACFGPDPVRVGNVGTAAAIKLAMNQLIAAMTAAFSLSLAFVEKNGLDPDRFMEILRQSALYAPTFDKKRQRMNSRDYRNPNFPVKHLLKDINLFHTAAEQSGLKVAGLHGIRQLLESTIENGFSDMDYSAIYDTIYPRTD
jgi:3-hydroxyisobutyrate dehydrogenase